MQPSKVTGLSETTARNETIDRLLHDAEHKDAAVDFTRNLMHDPQGARKFEQERDALIAEAKRLDPDRSASAWEDTSLPSAVIENAR